MMAAMSTPSILARLAASLAYHLPGLRLASPDEDAIAVRVPLDGRVVLVWAALA